VCLRPASGIGTRASLYAQALLVIVSVLLVGFSDEPNTGIARKLFKNVAINIATVMVTGSALLIGAFVQALRYDFDLYHGLVVLGLSWLNVLTVFVPLSVRFGKEFCQGLTPFRITFSDARHVGFLLYLSAVGAYGIWLAHNISDFGSFPECNSSLVWVVVGRSIQATAPKLRAFLLAVSCLAVIPILNVCFLGAVILIGLLITMPGLTWVMLFPRWSPFDSSSNRSDGRESTLLLRRALGYSPSGVALLAGAISIVLSVMVIASTEQLIALNKQHVGEGEDDWTFGQILALLVLVLPVWTLVGQIFADEVTDDGVPREGSRTPELVEATALERGDGTAGQEQAGDDSKST